VCQILYLVAVRFLRLYALSWNRIPAPPHLDSLKCQAGWREGWLFVMVVGMHHNTPSGRTRGFRQHFINMATSFLVSSGDMVSLPSIPPPPSLLEEMYTNILQKPTEERGWGYRRSKSTTWNFHFIFSISACIVVLLSRPGWKSVFLMEKPCHLISVPYTPRMPLSYWRSKWPYRHSLITALCVCSTRLLVYL